jgi:hypothetical protein
MTRKEAEAILDRGREETIRALLTLAEKAEKFDQRKKKPWFAALGPSLAFCPFAFPYPLWR